MSMGCFSFGLSSLSGSRHIGVQVDRDCIELSDSFSIKVEDFRSPLALYLSQCSARPTYKLAGVMLGLGRCTPRGLCSGLSW